VTFSQEVRHHQAVIRQNDAAIAICWENLRQRVGTAQATIELIMDYTEARVSSAKWLLDHEQPLPQPEVSIEFCLEAYEEYTQLAVKRELALAQRTYGFGIIEGGSRACAARYGVAYQHAGDPELARAYLLLNKWYYRHYRMQIALQLRASAQWQQDVYNDVLEVQQIPDFQRWVAGTSYWATRLPSERREVSHE